jgi:hypothetical protein
MIWDAIRDSTYTVWVLVRLDSRVKVIDTNSTCTTERLKELIRERRGEVKGLSSRDRGNAR